MIDEEITFREKGYHSYELPPKSNKLVYAVCDGEDCQREDGRGRWIIFHQYRALCYSCAIKIRPMEKCETPTEKLPWVDDDITFAEKGYRSTNLKQGSNKKVWAICANPDCEREGGRGRWVMFKACTELCYGCAMKIRYIIKGGDKIEKRECIDDNITYVEKGYKSTWLKPKSSMHVWAICANPDCQREGGRGRWVEFKHCSDLCNLCVCKTEEFRKRSRDNNIGEKCHFWKGGISLGGYCKLFNEPLKKAVRNYFYNKCFRCGKNIEKNGSKNMSVHHVNYQKGCGCDNTQFCIYVPLCNSCHGKTGKNRWYWYSRFMTELALRNPNYYSYHIPVVFYDEPSYDYSYVFEKNRK